MSDYSRNRYPGRCQTASAVSAATTRRSVCAKDKEGAAVPEWTTEHWKRRVEAEARGRLKRQVHGVGAAV